MGVWEGTTSGECRSDSVPSGMMDLLLSVSLAALFSSISRLRPPLHFFLHACCSLQLHSFRAVWAGGLLAGSFCVLHLDVFVSCGSSCRLHWYVVRVVKFLCCMQPRVLSFTSTGVSPPGEPFKAESREPDLRVSPPGGLCTRLM